MKQLLRSINGIQVLGVACAIIALALVLWHPNDTHISSALVPPQNEMDEWMSPTSTEATQYDLATSTKALIKQFRESIQPYLSKRDALVPMSVYEKDYATYGPDIMIDALNRDRFCHAQAHNLGRVIYAHVGNLADSLAICESKCTDGCIHGVLMGMFHAPISADDPTVQEITPALSAQIADTCTNPDIIQYTGIGNCYHAIGHVLASLVDEEVPQALSLCKSIFGAKYGEGAVYYCATGVYMQQSIASSEDTLASSTRQLAQCTSNLYPAACYRYNLHTAFNLPSEYQKATAFCLSLAGSQQQGCFHGLGFGAYKMVYQNPASLNVLCGTGTDIDKQMCIEGALGLISTSDKGFANSACELYTEGDRTMCMKAATIQNFGMNRDFDLYMQ